MKIVYLTDLSIQGSGYLSLSLPICVGLSSSGHDVKVVGLGNIGEQHSFQFPIFPAKTMPECMKILQGMYTVDPFDYLIVALDLPIQAGILNAIADRPFKYVGIFPIESDPLTISWAMDVMKMDKAFIISEFGTQEAIKKGIINAEHLVIGIDTNSWRIPTDDERLTARHAFGIDDDEFVVLTVADNQERKNLWANMVAFSKFAEVNPKSRYIMVTRERSLVGWNLNDLAIDLGIVNKFTVVDRGIPFMNLWTYYAMSDAFLLLSKAEGLGLPILESMAVGLPVVATKCTAIEELLSDGRGYLVPSEYIHVDPFGNGHRYWANAKIAATYLDDISITGHLTKNKAREYVENRTWKNTVDQLNNYFEEDNE